MTSYIDYGYYTGTYLGSTVPESDFDALAIQATAYIDRLTMHRLRDNPEAVTEQVKLAACSVLDEIYTQQQVIKSGGMVASESVGKHSISYVTSTDSPDKIRLRRLKQAAAIYLEDTGLLYRGRSYAG